jgi:hypothetical protein
MRHHDVITERTEGRMTLQVVYDTCDPMSPREWDNLGTILYTSNRYTLGDKRATTEEIEAIEAEPDNIVLPVYAYIHGGVVLSTGAFGCRFDSGQCGIIYCTLEQARKGFLEPNASVEDLRGRVEELFKAEVENYSAYHEGRVYGLLYLVDGIEIDASWGVYGDPEELLQTEWYFDPEYYKPINDYQI